MSAIYDIFQSVVLVASAIALVCVGVMLFAAKVAAPVWTAVRKWLSLPKVEIVVVGLIVAGLIQYGATKGKTASIKFDNGIKQGEAASCVTNDTVFISWQRDTSGGVVVPESATVYIDYKSNVETNAEWVLLAQTTVGAYQWSGTVEGATNYDYSVWAYYVPPEPVHTNGVWTYKTLKDRAGANALPLRSRVEVNGKAIATPKEKRKDEEK